MLQSFFKNYQDTKLIIPNPNIINFLLLGILICFVILQSKRNNNPSNFLDRTETEQLKGIAIFLVILGHLWLHVSATKPNLVFAGDAVALFLLLSGYGLTISSKKSPLEFKYFFSRRIRKVMLPYWAATILIFLLDYLFLGRTYSYKDILMTSLGINLGYATRTMDYTRWYVTFILMWYLIFYFVMSKTSRPRNLIVLFIISMMLFPLNYYFLPFVYQFFAFPIGCAIGIFYDELKFFFIRKKRYAFLFGLICVGYVILHKILAFDNLVSRFLPAHIVDISVLFIFDIRSMLIPFGLIIGVAYLGLKGLG